MHDGTRQRYTPVFYVLQRSLFSNFYYYCSAGLYQPVCSTDTAGCYLNFNLAQNGLSVEPKDYCFYDIVISTATSSDGTGSTPNASRCFGTVGVTSPSAACSAQECSAQECLCRDLVTRALSIVDRRLRRSFLVYFLFFYPLGLLVVVGLFTSSASHTRTTMSITRNRL